MSKNKLQRFAELNIFENAIQPGKEDLLNDNYIYKGCWAKKFFKNDNPVILELGCGKGEYTIGLALKFPDINFIGVDIKGDRLWKGAKTASDKKLNNVAFLRIQIENIELCFGNNEITEIWLTFPDPQPNKPKIKKRLSSLKFINLYKNIMIKDGIIHLKTDNTGLFDYTLDVIKEMKLDLIYKTHNLYNSNITDDILNIRTYYENMFIDKGFPICYLKFRL